MDVTSILSHSAELKTKPVDRVSILSLSAGQAS